jgi:hypothetical protein
MNTLAEMFGGFFCLSIVFMIQPAFVWVSAKCIQLDCSFSEAAAMAIVCILLSTVPIVGLPLSCVAFVLLFIRWLRAEGAEAVVAFSVCLVLESLLIHSVLRIE